MLLHIFFFNDTATTEIYTLSLHDALPISSAAGRGTRVMLWLPGVEALLAPPVPAGVPPSGTRVGSDRRRETETDASADTGEPPEMVAARPAPLEEGEPRA